MVQGKVMLFFVLLMAALTQADLLHVYDSTIKSGTNTEWKTGDTVFLHGKVYVDSGAVLKINPGVIVKAVFDSIDPAALFICKNAKIDASGTKANPIVFTSEYDTVINSFNSKTTRYTFGLWGGIVILGNAKVNTVSGSGSVLPYPFGSIEPRSNYGGTNDSDSSGLLNYVSIRYAGFGTTYEEGEDDYDDPREYAALTLGGVGRGTKISNIDIYNSKSDGIKVLGGSVNLTYCSVAMVRDNCIDISEGYHGRCQYMFVLLDFIESESYTFDYFDLSKPVAIRHSGAVTAGDSIPVLSNITFYGTNSSVYSLPVFLYFEKGAAARYYNNIVYALGAMSVSNDCAAFIDSGSIVVSNSLFDMTITTPKRWSDFFSIPALQSMAIKTTNKNYLDSLRLSILAYADASSRPIWQLKPTSSKLTTNIFDVSTVDPFFVQPSFKGAFIPTDSLWISGWTMLSRCNKYLIPDTLIQTGIFTKKEEKSKGQMFSVNKIHKNILIKFTSLVNPASKISVFNLNGKQCNVPYRFTGNVVELMIDNNVISNGYYICKIVTDDNRFNIPFTLSK